MANIICYWCSKEQSYVEGSFESHNILVWLKTVRDDTEIHTLILSPVYKVPSCFLIFLQ